MNKYIIIFLLSTNCYASTENSSDSFLTFLIFPFFCILMYLLLIRPQTKKNEEHKKLIDNIKINDEIITKGGFIGKIKKIFDDQFIILSINDNTDIIIQKEAVFLMLPKGTIKNFK